MGRDEGREDGKKSRRKWEEREEKMGSASRMDADNYTTSEHAPVSPRERERHK